MNIKDNRIHDPQDHSKANLCPGHGMGGRHPTREGLGRLSGHDDPGMFGRMFPNLNPLDVPDQKLKALAEAMLDPEPDGDDRSNPAIPGGYTYFGQFVDHDITLDLSSLSDKKRDPLGLENFRTPALDLDNVYGLGPDGSPHLYARNPDSPRQRGPKLVVGHNINVDFGGITGEFHNDLPRSPEGMALIGDPRNDENLVVAQTQLAFIKFHNAVCDHLKSEGVPDADIFDQARRTVTHHYQWLVLHDWMERLCGEGATDRILNEGRKYYRFKHTPYMPVEFSVAAYRIGHSMVRQRYSYNRVFPDTGFDFLFDFTGLSGGITGRLAPENPTAPVPVSNLPSNWIIDWRRFYDLDRPDGVAVNATKKIDALLAKELHSLPTGGGNLAERNLRRGVSLGLPSGQDVAREMGLTPLSGDQIASGPDGQVARDQGLHEATPLWYYILKEAEVTHNGERLGPVGATIISEVFVGLVHGDHQSYLWQEGKDWKPFLPSKEPERFTMADLLTFVNELNPIGD